MSLERHLNEEVTPWTGEHLHRYFEAKKYVNAGDTVLDLACGSGYGTDILSQVKDTTVYGGDIQADVIADCSKDWEANKSLHFEVMDATGLRFDDGFFDKIVSLETIEHLTAYKKMVSEFARVVKADGTVIISTPNIKVSSPDGIVVNPYHTQEFTYNELTDVLNAAFSDVKMYGQKYTRYFNKEQAAGMQGWEKLLLTRGIRKLPYSFRNTIFEKKFGRTLYPTFNDYQLFADKETIEKHCHVLFAVCKK
jgi:2-polyprenyl-3-methyl-5-hydroxy-6-metoxy-1,4-benzoquinol methylase